MDPRKMKVEEMPTTDLMFSAAAEGLSEEEVRYLYSLDGDSDFSPDSFARAKDMAVDALMTNFIHSYKYEDLTMAADIVAPPKKVRSRIGSYKETGQEVIDVSVSDTGSDKGETNEILMKVGSGTYTINIYKLKIFVSDDEIKEQGALNPIQEATVLLKHGLDLRQEIRIRNLADATTVGAAAATTWATSNTVNQEIAAGKNAVLLGAGAPATHILMREDTANLLAANPGSDAGLFGMVPQVMTTQAALSQQDGRKLFLQGLPWGLKPVISNAMYSTAVGPADDEVPALVWLASCFLFHVDKGSRATTWAMQPELMPLTIVRWRDEDRGGWYIKAVRKRTKVQVNAAAIYEITGVHG